MIWLILLLALNFAAVAYFSTRCTRLDLKYESLLDDFAALKCSVDNAVFKTIASVNDDEEIEDAA